MPKLFVIIIVRSVYPQRLVRCISCVIYHRGCGILTALSRKVSLCKHLFHDFSTLIFKQEYKHQQGNTEARYDKRYFPIVRGELHCYLVFTLLQRDSYKAVKRFFSRHLFAVHSDSPAVFVWYGREQYRAAIFSINSAFEISVLKACDLKHIFLHISAGLCKAVIIKGVEKLVFPVSFVIVICHRYAYAKLLPLIEFAEIHNGIIVAHKELTCIFHRLRAVHIIVLVLYPHVAGTLIFGWKIHIKI